MDRIPWTMDLLLSTSVLTFELLFLTLYRIGFLNEIVESEIKELRPFLIKSDRVDCQMRILG